MSASSFEDFWETLDARPTLSRTQPVRQRRSSGQQDKSEQVQQQIERVRREHSRIIAREKQVLKSSIEAEVKEELKLLKQNFLTELERLQNKDFSLNSLLGQRDREITDLSRHVIDRELAILESRFTRNTRVVNVPVDNSALNSTFEQLLDGAAAVQERCQEYKDENLQYQLLCQKLKAEIIQRKTLHQETLNALEAEITHKETVLGDQIQVIRKEFQQFKQETEAIIEMDRDVQTQQNATITQLQAELRKAKELLNTTTIAQKNTKRQKENGKRLRKLGGKVDAQLSRRSAR